jgi:hypothetical protein
MPSVERMQWPHRVAAAILAAISKFPALVFVLDRLLYFLHCFEIESREIWKKKIQAIRQGP